MPKTSEKPAELDATPVTEALADDVAAETATFEPGTPELLPHLQMPRMRRAKAYGALGEVQAQNAKVNPKAAEKVEKTEDGEDRPADDAEVEVDEIDPEGFLSFPLRATVLQKSGSNLLEFFADQLGA